MDVPRRARRRAHRGRAAGQGLLYRDRPLRLHRAARRARRRSEPAARTASPTTRWRPASSSAARRWSRRSARPWAGCGATGSSRCRTRPRRPRPSSASRRTALSNWATRSRSVQTGRWRAHARHAARPARHAARLPAARSTPCPTSPTSSCPSSGTTTRWAPWPRPRWPWYRRALRAAGFSMGGYVSFEIMRRALERVERLALIDTQATPDAAEATARRHALIEQTKIGRFHGVQPHAAAADRPSRAPRRSGDHPADPRHGAGDRRRGLRPRADRHHRDGPTAGRCWSTSRSRPW